MPNDAVITVTLDTALRDRFIAEADAMQRPAAEILQEFVQAFVRRRRDARQHDAWFRAEVEQSLREADDPSVARVPNEEVSAVWKLRRSKSAIDAETEWAARSFMHRLEGQYLAIEGLVFGSRARGTRKPESDADVAVVLEGEGGDRYKVSGDMAGIAFDVMLETGVLIDPLPLWEGELKRSDQFSNPALIEAIKRDGLRL